MGTKRKREILAVDILDVRSTLRIAGVAKATSASPNIVRTSALNMLVVSGGGAIGTAGSGYFQTGLTNVFQVLANASGAPSAGVSPNDFPWAPDYDTAGAFWIYKAIASGEVLKAGTSNISYVAFGT